MEKSLFTTNVTLSICSIKIDNEEHFSFFVFGSSLISSHPNDIDIIIIYNNLMISYEEAANVRAMTKSKIEKDFQKKSHIVTLSESEAEQTQFLNKVEVLQVR